ncbi:hypothetical protein ScPMuIL_008049 [Solemya velum]
MHSDKVSTTASESRKSSKPIMEKRRRARINASLAELKSLLLEVIKKEGARHSKMEKADILEMTVKHLRQLQRQQFSAVANSDPSVLTKYRVGFNECASEVTRFLGTLDTCDIDLRTRLLNHLANCMINSSSPEVSPVSTSSVSTSGVASTPSRPSQSSTESTCSSPSPPPMVTPKVETTVQTSQEMNNNVHSVVSLPQQLQMTKIFSGLQVIPTKMNSGEIAFVLPTNVLSNNQAPNYVIPVYSPPSAPTSFAPTAAAAAAAAAATVSAPNVFTLAPSTTSNLQPCTFASLQGNINVISGSSISNNAAVQFPSFTVNDSTKQITGVDAKILPAIPISSADPLVGIHSMHVNQPIFPNHERSRGQAVEHCAESDGDMWRPW